ncbi:MAG TPA: hypothetical protein VGF71_15340 [Caulobacteraceae bacterium]|jgi:hypothetical protein
MSKVPHALHLAVDDGLDRISKVPHALHSAVDDGLDRISKVPQDLHSAIDDGIAFAYEKPAEFLAWLADCAISGLPGFPSALELAEQFRDTGAQDRGVEALVESQIDFVRNGTLISFTGVGSLSAAVFAELEAPWLLKIRLVLAVASLLGFEPGAPETRSLAFACLCGNDADAVIASTGMAEDEHDRTVADRATCMIVSKRFAKRQTAKGAVRASVMAVGWLTKKFPILDRLSSVSDRIYQHVDVTDLIQVSKAATRIFGHRAIL